MPNTFNLNSFLPIPQYKLYSYERPRAGFWKASFLGGEKLRIGSENMKKQEVAAVVAGEDSIYK
jgi:hypothetical protein